MPLNCLTYPVVRGSVAFNSLHRHYHKSIYFVTNQDRYNNIVAEWQASITTYSKNTFVKNLKPLVSLPFGYQ